ncbi:hypothetical protein K505DRAFT_363785 [Melanomma pulvis-pyrius CBS 109.77]|uniref:DUF7626 domain-containing protein n=1 Tax=Melanomma pulvis-pyrius CBS 109.77 TaxID=1314802 RepID=A0A6A6X5S8_9PLEO|nr:hypothetical protein K505DRAFT_363785 [Melanomma pulvis-pyrius CBS 109.77]
MQEEDDEGELEGYADLHNGNDDYVDTGLFVDDNGHALGPHRKKTRPAFFSRSTDAAERAARRTQVCESETFLLDEENEYLHGSSSRVPGTFGRRNRGKGKKGEPLPAYHKKVSADLDSDDELIMKMREKGFSDKQISDKLAKDGRIRYDQKSISTRIARIRLAQCEHVDYLLEEGYKEWQYDDDVLLLQAYELANIELNYEIERIRAWRFRKVSEYMRRLNQDAIFSAKACTSRYQALMDGTAKIPSELDDDPEARFAEMEAYRMEREQIREAERQEKEEKCALQRKIKDESRLRNAQKAEEAATRQKEMMNKRAEKAMKRAAQSQLKAQRARENESNRKIQLERIKAEKAAEEVARVQKRKKMNRNTTLTVSRVDSFKSVNADTPDPRSYLSIEDLQTLCSERSLSTMGRSTSEFVQRLRDADDQYSLNDIKNVCRSRGLNTAGNKVQLKYNLALAIAKKFTSFNQNRARENKNANENENQGKCADTGMDVGGDGDEKFEGAFSE